MFQTKVVLFEGGCYNFFLKSAFQDYLKIIYVFLNETIYFYNKSIPRKFRYKKLYE